MIDDNFHHRVMIDQLFGEADRSSHQASASCAQEADAFNGFSKHFSDSVFCLWQHGPEGVPIIRQKKINIQTFELHVQVFHRRDTTPTHGKGDDLILVHRIGIQHPHLRLLFAYI